MAAAQCGEIPRGVSPDPLTHCIGRAVDWPELLRTLAGINFIFPEHDFMLY